MNQPLPNQLYSLNTGTTSSNPFIETFMTRDPNANDKNYQIQQRWFNLTSNVEWILVGFTTVGGSLQAIWESISAFGTDLTLTGNSGGAVSALSNNFNLLGSGLVNVVGVNGTGTLTISVSGSVPTKFTGNDSSFATPSGNNLNVIGASGINVTGSGSTLTITGSGVSVNTLSDDSETVVMPLSGNIQLNGKYYRDTASPTIVHTTIAGANSIQFNPMTTARIIVDALSNQGGTQWNGQYSTISSACAAANVGDTIFVMPGTYIENPTLPAGVNLCSYDPYSSAASAVIEGTLTMTAAGTSTISGIGFIDNAGVCISVSGTNAVKLILTNCYINVSAHNAISFTNSNSSSSVFLQNCGANINGTGIALYNMSCPGTLQINNMIIQNNGSSTTSATNSAGIVKLFYVISKAPIGCNGGTINNLQNCQIDTAAINAISLNIISGSLVFASAINITNTSTLQLTNATVTSSNTNAISGDNTSTIKKSPIIYPGTSSTIQGTLTVVSITVA